MRGGLLALRAELREENERRLAGQAVALERRADVSGDARFACLSRACVLRASRLLARARWSRPMLGLWQGALGIALVALSRSSMPALEPP